MRVLLVVLGACLILLQYRLWVSDQGVREVWRLKAQVHAQQVDNEAQRERNRRLAAEVSDLKSGLTALEERARSDLGMVAGNETFYQVVSGGAAEPAMASTSKSALTARAQ
jgi:cell division protein FtsB